MVRVVLIFVVKIYPEYKQNRKTKYRVNRSNSFTSQDDEKMNMITNTESGRIFRYFTSNCVVV